MSYNADHTTSDDLPTTNKNDDSTDNRETPIDASRTEESGIQQTDDELEFGDFDRALDDKPTEKDPRCDWYDRNEGEEDEDF